MTESVNQPANATDDVNAAQRAEEGDTEGAFVAGQDSDGDVLAEDEEQG